MRTHRIYRTLIPLVLALLAWGIAHLSLLDANEDKAYDLALRHMRLGARDPRIVLAGIDDKTYQDGFFNREAHAQFLLNMKEHNAAAVFMDVEFDTPKDQAVDQQLAEVVADNGHVVLATVLGLSDVETDQGILRMLCRQPLIDFLEQCFEKRWALPGLINTFPDFDGTIRKAPIAMRTADLATPWPSPALSLNALVNGLYLKDIEYKPETGQIVVPPNSVPTAHVSSLDGTGREGRELYMLPIAYQPPATGPNARLDGSFPVIPYHQLIDPESKELDRVAGAIVLVGDNSSGDTDLYATPFGMMKGVEIHAQTLNTLLHGPYLRYAPEWVNDLFTFLFCLALTLTVMRARDKASVAFFALVLLVSQVGIYLLALRQGTILTVVDPLLGSLLAIIFAMLARLVMTASVLERYVPPEVVTAMLSTGRSRPRAGDYTVIVSDIRGYTTLSEGKTPVELLRMLNEYHSVTVAIYEKHGGRALTYQGDAQIIAFSNQGRKNSAAGAIRAAQEMQTALHSLRLHWGLLNQTDFDVGAAVCTGPVTLGEIGTTGSGRAEYTVIGQTVRRAHKIQGLSQELGCTVLLDEETLKASTLSLHLESFQTTLEGSNEPTTVYGLRALEEQAP